MLHFYSYEVLLPWVHQVANCFWIDKIMYCLIVIIGLHFGDIKLNLKWEVEWHGVLQCCKALVSGTDMYTDGGLFSP